MNNYEALVKNNHIKKHIEDGIKASEMQLVTWEKEKLANKLCIEQC